MREKLSRIINSTTGREFGTKSRTIRNDRPGQSQKQFKASEWKLRGRNEHNAPPAREMPGVGGANGGDREKKLHRLNTRFISPRDF